ncbi:hypothetical protein Ahy_B01g053298 [Arachis hypogaea]|uniref:Ubiquitin-like protease family profile domain-containing protein n=1 Tax=Arachis hypogaea TaxID=3818 RepID=A0A445ARG3_ARAHY|nr:hypothetical protein Ahy_B01g053298 [Arachis hypogaea]
MERHLHALNTQTVTYGKLFHFFHFFHFSKRFENKETLPFSSENQSLKYTSHCSKPPSKHHQTLHQESEEKTKQQYSTSSEKMAARNQTKYLKCATHLLSDKFRNMSEEKKAIVRDLGFGGLMHISPLRVDHQLLRELANNFKLGENRLKTGYGSFQITPKIIGDALGINATGDLFSEKVEYKKLSDDDKIIFRRFQGKTLKSLTDEMMEIGVGNEEERLMFKRIFILYIQMAWTAYRRETGGACFDLHVGGKNDCRKRGNFGKIDSRKRKKSQEESNSDSESESESSDEREESSPVEKEKKKKKTKTSPKNERYEILSDELDEWLRQNVDKSAAEGENQADLQSTEGRYVSSETIPAVNLGSDDPSSQGRTEQSSVNQPLSPTNLNVMVEGTDAVGCACNVFVPASQTTTETDFEPTPMLQIERTIETTPETPKQLQETTPTLPPAPTKIHPAAEDAAALLMMARTATYVPKTDPGVPSFSLGLTDSSQEGASTQETERAKSPEAANLIEQLDDLVQKIASSVAKEKNKSPQIQRETGGESSGKFKTPGATNHITDDMKQKCYIWGTRLKEDADGNTNEYEEMCTLIAQDEYILMRMHLASLQAKSDIESQIVSAICLILNQKNEKRFQEQIYCLPPDIVSMALSDHPDGEFISLKTNKEFRVEDYPSFIPFIDRKKLTSHPYIFAPVCHSGYWWLWLINTTKRKCHILDPLHKKAPSDERKQINKFTGYVFSRLRAYAGGEPLQKDKKEKEIKASYVKISGQKISYDCPIYVMKWLELIEPKNIKKGNYEWDNWPQEEVDHYRVEYASRILFSEMNKERDRAIRESNAIRLSKPSSVLLSPFCQINSADIETA